MFKFLIPDFKSSIVVFLISLPLCLGIALACQAPLASGLLSGIIGGLLVAAISNSPLIISGPTAGLTVLVAYSIHQLGDFRAFCVAIFLSGLLQIIFSFLKADKLGNYFPSSVVKGMLSAIGIILILKQFPHAIGYDASYMGSETFLQPEEGGNTFSGIFSALNMFHPGCTLIAILSFIVIISWDRFYEVTHSRFARLVPSRLLAVIGAIFLNRFVFSGTFLEIEPRHEVNLPFGSGLRDLASQINLPDWGALMRPDVYAIAFAIAVIVSIESMLNIEAVDKIDPQRRFTSKNRELLAQGIGNAVAGLMGGLPLTTVVVRTSANIDAGAKSKLSTLLSGLWLFLAVLLAPHLISMIPLSVLAVILILVGYRLTKPQLFRKMYRSGMDQFIPFMVTIVAILLTDLLKGIAAGMIVGFFFVMRRNIHQSIVMVNDEEKHYLIRFMKDISFFQKDTLVNMLRQIPYGAELTIDGSKDIFVDHDVVDLIEDFMEAARHKNISVELRKSPTALSPCFRLEK